MGPLQPNSSFVNFCDVWSQFRQLLLSTGELWPLGPCKRRGSRGEGGSAKLWSRWRAQTQEPCVTVPALPLTGCVT